MGRIAAPFGVKGWVRVQSFADDPATLVEYASWRIGRGEQQREFAVDAVQDHSHGWVAKLAGIDDREAAYALRGQEISVARSSLPPPAEGEYFWSDLIGLAAVNRDGVELGTVDSLLQTGAHDLLVVKGKREHLIPFIAQFVGTVDVAAGRIEVDWGEDY